MNLIELDRALKQLRLGGMAAVLETRLRQAQAEPLAPGSKTRRDFFVTGNARWMGAAEPPAATRSAASMARLASTRPSPQ